MACKRSLRWVSQFRRRLRVDEKSTFKLSARLVRARGQVLDQVFNEDKIATKIVAEEWVGQLKEPVSKKFWCKSLLIKRRKKCAREVL
jgi:hypothetical protein